MAELRAALTSVQDERAALQQDLRAAINSVELLENDARLKTTRLEAAERALAAEQARHGQEAGALEEQLQSAQAAQAAAQSEALAATGDAEAARRAAEEAAAGRGRVEAALAALTQQHEALVVEHSTLRQQVRRGGFDSQHLHVSTLPPPPVWFRIRPTNHPFHPP